MSATELFYHFKQAIKGEIEDFTVGSIRRSIFYLAIPMILEMVMESLFALVDIFFVGKLGVNAVATVGLTESVITIIYAISIGLSMAATAIVARRIGEKKYKAASDASFQAILLGFIMALVIGAMGYGFAEEILQLMGASASVIAEGIGYTRIIFAGNVSIMLLFIINGAFRGAGNAAIAMRTLWLANGINIILDPLLIFGLGPIPALGIEGAAWATTLGRTIGVLYQLFYLAKGSARIQIRAQNVVIRYKTVVNIFMVSLGGMGQFLIDSASWIFLTRIVSEFGSVALAAYTIAFRIVAFTILPAWGLSNAAATLVGQNLGAGQPERAERSVWQTAKYNVIFLGIVSVIFLLSADVFVSLFSSETDVVLMGAKALKIFCLGYVFFAYGMVVVQSFNGAGDTRTPTLINLGVFWLLQIPVAYLLALQLGWGATGVFATISICHSLHALISGWVFRKGKWKMVKV